VYPTGTPTFGFPPVHALWRPSWRLCTLGLSPSHDTQCHCGHCSSHEVHSSENEDVKPKSHLYRIRVLLQEKNVGSALCADDGPQLLDFSHIFRLTIRAKESERCLCLKSSSCKMTWRSRRLPVAPCRLGLLLVFCLCTTVRVRCRAFGCRGEGPAREGSCASLPN
jgi:hypothetical protein